MTIRSVLLNLVTISYTFYTHYVYIPLTDNPHFDTFSLVSVVMCCSCSTITDIPSSPILLPLTLSTCRVQFPTNILLIAIAPVVIICITILYIIIINYSSNLVMITHNLLQSVQSVNYYVEAPLISLISHHHQFHCLKHLTLLMWYYL